MGTRDNERLTIFCEGCKYADENKQKCIWISEPYKEWHNGRCKYKIVKREISPAKDLIDRSLSFSEELEARDLKL